MALSNEERYGIERCIDWLRLYNERKRSQTCKLSERIDWLAGVLDALDNAEFALEYCDTQAEYIDELKTLYNRDLNSYRDLSRTTNHTDAHYYHGSSHTLHTLIGHAELLFI